MAATPALLSASLRWSAAKEAEACETLCALLACAAEVRRPEAGPALVAAGGAAHACLSHGVRLSKSAHLLPLLEAAETAPPSLRAPAAAALAALLGGCFGLSADAPPPPPLGAVAEIAEAGDVVSGPLVRAGGGGAAAEGRRAMRLLELWSSADGDEGDDGTLSPPPRARQAAAWALADASRAAQEAAAAEAARSGGGGGGGGTASGWRLDALPADSSAIRAVSEAALGSSGDGGGAAVSVEAQRWAFLTLAALPRLPPATPWATALQRALREQPCELAAAAAALCAAHAQREPPLAALLSERLLASAPLRALPADARAALLRAPGAQKALAAMTSAAASEALRIAAEAAAADPAGSEAGDAVWGAVRSLLAGQPCPSREGALAALPELVRLLDPASPADGDRFRCRPPAVGALLGGATRLEALVVLRSCDPSCALRAAHLRVWLARARLLTWPDLAVLRVDGGGDKELLRHAAAALAQGGADAATERREWLRWALAQAARGVSVGVEALQPLAVLAAEWEAVTATLCLHAAPGGVMDALFAALPGAMPPVAAACGLTEDAATVMLELGEAAGAGCLGGLAAACVRGMREHLEPPLLCRLAALEETQME